jgi:recombination associated protein RdgC
MGVWLKQGEAPGRFSIDQDLELQATDASKATVRYTRHPLDGRQVQAHLSAGLAVRRLGLTWSDRISFILDEKLQLKRVEFLDMGKDTPDGGEIDAAEQFDVDFALMAGELARMLKDLVEALGGEARREQAAAA